MPSTHSILGGLSFQEVGYDPSGTPGFDTNGNSAADGFDEYIAITNTSASTINLTNVQIWEAELIHAFGSGSIAPGQTIYIVAQGSLAGAQTTNPSATIVGASNKASTLTLGNSVEVIGLLDTGSGAYTELAWGVGAGSMAGLPGFSAPSLVGRDSAGDIADGQTLQFDGGGNLIAANATLCFAEGSLILTDRGEVAVETLKAGDRVVTATGGLTAVKWIGRQTLQRHRYGPDMEPVRIRAGALGGELPHSDLTVTADHGMVLEGLVINASALVNGHSIDFVPTTELQDSFTVYHIETENHDVILANGAASETFIDAVTRSHFDNYQEYLDLYGAERIIPEMPALRISAARLVPQAIRDRLNGRDQDLGWMTRSA